MSNLLVNRLPTRYVHNGSSGSGGFSDVLYCIDSHLGRSVAIKTIRDPDEFERLQDEISALLKLRSKHVVQVFDIVNYNASLAIVMEYIDGDDLFETNYHTQSSEHLLKVLWQIASGISDIHSVGLIHRDIKPNNMKLDRENIVKIFDFGLSRDSELNAMTRGFKGTRGFSAPEQYAYGEVNFTSAIDVYAFGITALLLATSKIPQPLLKMPPNKMPAGCFDCKHLNHYPTLKELFERCLEEVPINRPSMVEVKHEISKYLLFDKHQAVVVVSGSGKGQELNSAKRNVTISSLIGSFEIHYDGLRFLIQRVTGEVFVNNIPAKSNSEISGACVIGLGNINRDFSQRNFVTFDISNPEVTL